MINSIELTESAIMERGTMVLLKELGYSGFIKYLKMLTNGNQDYMTVQNKIYEGQSIDDIFEAAKKSWEEQK